MIGKKNLAISILSGLLLGFSFPPFNIGFLAWIFLIPLIHIYYSEVGFKEKILSFYIASFVGHAIITHWVALNSGTSMQVAIFSYLALCFFYSFYWVLYLVLVHISIKNIFLDRIEFLIWPIMWIAIEAIRAIGPLAAPWLNLSLSQSNYDRIIQLISINEHFLAFIVIILNLLLYKLIALKRKQYLVYFATALISSIMIGQSLILKYNYSVFTKDINISIGQPVIYPDEKWNPMLKERNKRIMNDLLDNSLSKNPDIVVWPEAALTSFLAIPGSVERKEIQQKLEQSSMITGIPERVYDDDGLKIYNSAIFMRSDGFYDTYQKIFLVPFAEYVPFFKKWISKMNQFDDMGSFSKGKNYKTFKVNDVTASILICYDSSSYKLAKKMVENGAEIIFVITNDSYVGKAMPHQHFQHAKLRAIELGVPVVQSANNGISGIILPSGEVLIKSEIDERNTFNSLVKLR
ncbi:MAG: apolipoprotein N-acyltransferase [Candidatus Neomarinimicrobiota bacterium]